MAQNCSSISSTDNIFASLPHNCSKTEHCPESQVSDLSIPCRHQHSGNFRKEVGENWRLMFSCLLLGVFQDLTVFPFIIANNWNRQGWSCLWIRTSLEFTAPHQLTLSLKPFGFKAMLPSGFKQRANGMMGYRVWRTHCIYYHLNLHRKHGQGIKHPGPVEESTSPATKGNGPP